jgi:2-C-methyl-D-erythritol 4-phosphate cytidylyltransferase
MRLNAIRAQHKTIDNQAQDYDMAVTFSDVCAVVPAAGFGRRMQTECPKQYLSIGDKTILEHSVAALLAHPRVTRVVIAISPGDAVLLNCRWRITRKLPLLMAAQSAPTPCWQAFRLPQARSGCWCMTPRPCLHQDDLARLLALSETSTVGGILAAPVRDTMKRAEPGKQAIAHTVERVDLWHALTPQFFPASCSTIA